eukprot:1143188-Pelagomonas_calceolata.AAC.3
MNLYKNLSVQQAVLLASQPLCMLCSKHTWTSGLLRFVYVCGPTLTTPKPRCALVAELVAARTRPGTLQTHCTATAEQLGYPLWFAVGIGAHGVQDAQG